MKSFKQVLQNSPNKKEEFIAFSNAGGRKGQYDRFDYTESFMHGQGGGPKEDIDENLNPRNEPQGVKTNSSILFDPEKDNKGLGEEHNNPEHFTPDYHGTGHVQPNYNNEQAKNVRELSSNTKEDDNYHRIIHPYTTNSYNLNNTLIQHHKNKTQHPRIIKSHSEDDSEIDTELMDHLIKSHKLPHDMTVYSGLHFHPNEHKGKIAHIPSYMSTSLSPHVAKDFGKEWEMPSYENGNFKNTKVKNILRLHLPKGHEHLFTDNGSLFPGQGELILPRGMRYQLGQRPTHIIRGKFYSHFGDGRDKEDKEFHIYTGRVLPK